MLAIRTGGGESGWLATKAVPAAANAPAVSADATNRVFLRDCFACLAMAEVPSLCTRQNLSRG